MWSNSTVEMMSAAAQARSAIYDTDAAIGELGQKLRQDLGPGVADHEKLWSGRERRPEGKKATFSDILDVPLVAKAPTSRLAERQA